LAILIRPAVERWARRTHRYREVRMKSPVLTAQAI